MTNLDNIFKSWANKGLSSQSYGFISSRVWMWELDHKESWAPKNCCFWTVVLEKTLESSLYCKGIKPISPKGNQSWIFIGKTDAEAEAPILWSPDAKNWLIGKDPDAGKVEFRRRSGRQRMRWLDGIANLGHELELAPEVGDGKGSLARCSPWQRKESDTTEWLHWSEVNFTPDLSCHFFWQLQIFSLPNL